MPGRPLLCSDDLIARICKHIRVGNYFVTACEAEGLDPAVGRHWLAFGKRGEKASIYTRFYDAVCKTAAEAETNLVTSVYEQRSNWQGALEILKRRFPERWSERVQVTVRDELDDFLSSIEHQLDEATFQKILRIAASKFAPQQLPAAGLTVIEGEAETVNE